MAARKRVLGPLTWIDLIIIGLIVVGAVAGVLVYINMAGKVGPMEEVEATWTILVPDIRAELAEKVKVGEEVRLDVAADAAGKVTDFVARPAKVEVPTADGKLVTQDSQVKYDLLITVKGPGEYNGINLYVGGRPLKLNDTIDIYSNAWHYRGVCADIWITRGEGQ